MPISILAFVIHVGPHGSYVFHKHTPFTHGVHEGWVGWMASSIKIAFYCQGLWYCNSFALQVGVIAIYLQGIKLYSIPVTVVVCQCTMMVCLCTMTACQFTITVYHVIVTVGQFTVTVGKCTVTVGTCTVTVQQITMMVQQVTVTVRQVTVTVRQVTVKVQQVTLMVWQITVANQCYSTFYIAGKGFLSSKVSLKSCQFSLVY